MAIVNEENEIKEINKKLEDNDEPQDGADKNKPSSSPPSVSRNNLLQSFALQGRQMAEEMLEFREMAQYFSKKETNYWHKGRPIIIATKGDPFTGRKLMAFLVASTLGCPLIKQEDFVNYKENSEENQTKLWGKICNLARTQITSWHPIVIDTELADPNQFDQLKELSEVTNTPLAVFEFRTDVEELWKSIDCQMSTIEIFFLRFIEKPKSHYVNSASYDMGEIPKFLLEVESLADLFLSVSGTLKDFRAYIDPGFESEVNCCYHREFEFIDIADMYKKCCCQCGQLVSGSVYCCLECRLIIHRTCSYFPQELRVQGLVFETWVTLKLENMGSQLNADASCSCCKQLLRSSTSSQYYSTDFRSVFFDLDCLFLLPAKRTTRLHEHELLRAIYYNKQASCKECHASINEKTIFYFCDKCNIAFDVFCLWLPETTEINRDKHPLKLSVLPRVDSDPYFCHGCEKERDTDKWIYYCDDCDYQSHPRCILEAPSIPRSITEKTEISTIYKKWRDPEFLSSIFDLTTEGGMAKELLFQRTVITKNLPSLFYMSMKEIDLPIIIATKGHSNTGRKLVAFTLAAALDCMLIDEDNRYEVANITNEPNQVSYREFSQIALTQLQLGLSVVIDSDLLHHFEFCILRDFSAATETPLFIVDCKPCDEYELWHNTFPNITLEDFQSIISSCSEYNYDVGNTPKLLVNVTPTFDGIMNFMPHLLDTIAACSKEWSKEHTRETKFDFETCYIHDFCLGSDYDVSKDKLCNRCLKHISTPFRRCSSSSCEVVLHTTCTELPLRILVGNYNLIFKKYGDDKVKAKYDCCNKLLKDYAYTSKPVRDHHYGDALICVDCLLTPPKPGINLHEHPLELVLSYSEFECGACGSICKEKNRYMCFVEGCGFKLGVKCGWLKETEPFDRHRHPFHLIISPEHVSNQYYCEVCQEERDKKHWVYCCMECDYFIHIHCLVPEAGCPPSGA